MLPEQRRSRISTHHHSPELRLQAADPPQVGDTPQADGTPRADLRTLGAAGIIPQSSPSATLLLARDPLRECTHTVLRRVLTALALGRTLLERGGPL